MLPKTVTTFLKLVGTVSPKSRKQKFLQIVCSTNLSIGGVVVDNLGFRGSIPGQVDFTNLLISPKLS